MFGFGEELRLEEEKVVENTPEDVALLAWANRFLRSRNLEATHVHSDFADGVLMINLLEVAFQEKVCRSYNSRPKQRFHKMDNVEQMLSYLQTKNVSLLK